LLMKLPGPLNSDQEKQLSTIQTSARHLLSLINDLLDLAKIESGDVKLVREPVSCQGVIEDVATVLRPLAEGKGLQFKVESPKEEVIVQADRRALSQILLNLSNNAIKFTEQGEIRLALARRSEDGRAVAEISMTDTGIGIRAEDQVRLFGAFEQVNLSDGRPQGKGLGLHLSRKLADLLGAQITLQSEYGRGSTFTLVIPER
jgi:signal transduction histidine kinase